jgi:AcrR family transcriptional regulator
MRFATGKHKIPDVMVKERILEAAFFEFSEKGFYGANVDSITKRIGVKRIVFYSYFKNKKDVLVCLLEHVRYELTGFFSDKRGQKLWLNTDSVTDFQQPVVYVSALLAESSGIIRALVQGMLIDRQLFSLFSDLVKDFASVFEPKIKSIKGSGHFQGCGITVLAQIMAVTLLMSIFSHSIGAFRCSIEVLAKQISIFLYAAFHVNEKAVRSSNFHEPKSEKTRKTKKMILAAAKNELSVGGKAEITISSIARQAGINRSTVYLHYKSKDEIVKALSGDPDNLLISAKLRTPLNRSEARTTIIEAGIKVFSDNGYFRTTIDMVAAEARCSRSTIYKYFKGKDGIVSAIFDEMFILFNPAINVSDSIIHQADTTRIDSLMEVNGLFIDIFEKYSAVYRVLLQGSLQSEELRKQFIDIYGRIDKPMTKKIIGLQKEGRCNAVFPVIASRIIQTYHAHTIWMFNAGIIQCTKHELSLALAKFLYCFFNFK